MDLQVLAALAISALIAQRLSGRPPAGWPAPPPHLRFWAVVTGAALLLYMFVVTLSRMVWIFPP